MKTNYLLPHKYKTIGWILFITGITFVFTIFFLIYNFIDEPSILNVKVLNLVHLGDQYFNLGNLTFFKVIKTNIFPTITLILLIIGGLLISFSKEKIEDEYILKLREESMVWAFLVNFIILLFTTLFIYGSTFMFVMGLNMFTPLLFFIIRFNFLKIKSRSHEE